MGRTPPVLATEIPGNFITGALWNAQVGGIGSFAFNPPIFKGVSTTAQSVPTGSGNVAFINLTSAVVDTEGGWSSTTNPSRYTIQSPGRYLAIGNMAFPGTSASDVTARNVSLYQNGTTIRVLQLPACGTSTWGAQIVCPFLGAVGDYIQLGASTMAASALNTITSPVWNQPTLELYWLGAN
jgi:hypothetical protein